MQHLSLKNIENISQESFDKRVLEFPEKIVQFGTGVLLKGLPDLIIDNANKQGEFCGRIVMVKSTDSGSIESLASQDYLYTVGTQGIKDGELINKSEICTSISRILIASTQWNAVLRLSRQDEIQYIFSNTTEVGITYNDEKITAGNCPESFPGKVVAFLKSRFEHFNGDLSKGLIFLPAELVSDNGTKLEAIVTQMAEESYKDKAFLSWIKTANVFCNTLVDRIVPGAAKSDFTAALPYKDDNAIIVEPYALWAIEGDEALKEKLTFCLPESGAFVVPSIESYKEIKLRLLNASHTFSSGFAFLSGFELVKDAMANEDFLVFIQNLMLEEISPSMTSSISEEEKKAFALNVIDRFKNPFLEHQWLSICMNYSSKMAARCLPLILSYIHKTNEIPERMTLGFACHLRFLKPVVVRDGKYFGQTEGKEYPINDPNAAFFYEIWSTKLPLEEKIKKILQNEELWGENLNNLNRFVEKIYNTLSTLEE